MKSKQSLRHNKKAVSPAVSTVIITAASVVLVLVAGNYALQILESQRAIAEFDTVQKSILSFDDAVRDIAWDQSGSRSIRFTNSYGNMRLIADGKTLNISSSGLNGTLNYVFTTSAIKYQIATGYGMPAVGSSYILGDDSNVISKLTDSLGQASMKYESGYNTITLNYRVRVGEEGSMEIGGARINYVDIFVIRLNCNSSTIGSGDFNLACKNIGLKTIQSSTFKVTDNYPHISVSDSIKSNQIDLNLPVNSLVIFNTIIADVRVSY